MKKIKYFGIIIFIGILVFLFNYKNFVNINKLPVTEYLKKGDTNKESIMVLDGKNIIDRFKTPKGYERIAQKSGSYGEYLRTFPLKPDGTPVFYFNKKQKLLNVHQAVLDIDVGEQDLQQCADSVMRLWAEYNYKMCDYKKIHFNFTNGFRADYLKWREGYTIRVRGNDSAWQKTQNDMTTYKSFREYLNMVFAYAGTLSLSQEMKKIPLEEMHIGDVFLKGNDPGHCVLVVDMAENKNTGKKVFMVAQGYMSAQDIHILKNLASENISPWYELDFGDELKTPQWKFTKEQLYRFGE